MKTKKHKKTMYWWWIAVLAVVISLGLYIVFFRQSTQQPSSSNYVTYQDLHGFTIEYPQNWIVRTDTQVFENGDAVAFRKKGPTQKEQTELTDGAQMAISKPFTIDTSLAMWMKERFTGQAKFSQSTLTQYTFETVEDCSNLGCMTYYFTLVDGQIYGIALFAQGPNAEKAAYENALLHMLKSLEFTDSQLLVVSEEEAVATVNSLPEVMDYLKRVPNGLVAVNGEEDTRYMVQVYEIKDGHTATFNWYQVDKMTGEVEKEF